MKRIFISFAIEDERLRNRGIHSGKQIVEQE